MTLSFRTTRRVYMGSPASAGDGVLTNPQTALDGTAGAFVVTTEADRNRLYDAGNPFTPAADFLGRVVSVSSTPNGAAGTDLHDNTWFIISEVDAGGNWIRLEGFRAEAAGTNITYRVHASVDFSAASAAFAADEGPLGDPTGVSAPYPATRTNIGPTVGQAIFFPGSSNDILSAQPYMVGALNPGGGGASTTCRLVDWTGRHATLPTATGQRWELRDMPAYTEEMLYLLIHRFILMCGWDLFQSRGKNDGTGAGRFIQRDTIYRSYGEDNLKEGYLRMVAVNSGNSADGSYSTDSFPRKGIDFAMYGAWDRTFTNAAGINQGAGINQCSPHVNANNLWAAGADSLNTTASNQPPFWAPDLNAGNSGSAIGDIVGWNSQFHATANLQSARRNALGTVEGGDLVELHYTFIGDRDEIHLLVERPGFGNLYIGFGFLNPRPGANANIFTLNRAVTNGASRTLRIGGVFGNPTSDGEDPTNPSSGLPYQVGDTIQIAGKTVNAGVTVGPPAAHNGEFITDAQIVAFPGLLPAVGTIQVPAGSQIVDGDTITISDGTLTETFEFDDDASVTGGNVTVTFTSGDSASTVAAALDAAIAGTSLNVTVSTVTSTLTITSGLTGSGVGAGNVPFTSSLANAAQWTLDGMNGGGYSIQVAQLDADYAVGAKVGEDPDPIFIYTHHKSVRNAGLHTNPYNQVGAFITNNRAGYTNPNDPSYFNGALPGGSSGWPGYLGYEAFGALQSVDNFGESAPNRSGGRFSLIPIICRDETGGQLRGTLRYLRMVSARVADHKFVADRSGAYHYIAPSFLQDSDGEVSVGALAGNFAVGPLAQAAVLV